MWTARAAGSGPRRMSSCSVTPRTYSRMRKYEPSSVSPKSVAVATFGCWMCAPAIASRSNRCTSSGSRSVSGWRILIAMRRRMCTCSPR